MQPFAQSLLLSNDGNYLFLDDVQIHFKNKRYFQVPVFVFQLVTNMGLVSVPGRTNQYLEGLQQEYNQYSYHFEPQYLYLGRSKYKLVLPGTDTSPLLVIS